MSTSGNYIVEVEKYAERHYIAGFKKKYKGAWDITWKALAEEFKRIETLIGVNNFVETITDRDGILLCKTEFRVAGTEESRHRSGNRCIVAVHKNTRKVNVLLVYGKGDIRGKHETAWWQAVIKETYSQYAKSV